jgi:CheY-like chemotaxis protein
MTTGFDKADQRTREDMLPLAEAAALVYQAATGLATRDSNVLEKVAASIAKQVTIYCRRNGGDHYSRVRPTEFASGTISDAAKVFKFDDGRTPLLHLAIRRYDLSCAKEAVRSPASNAIQAPTPRNQQPVVLTSAKTSIPRSILVVDENADAAQSLALVLRQMGHFVECAYDGGRALRTARRIRPDIVFLDLAMPGMDGYEVAHRLRQDSAFDKVLIVALTGHGSEEHRRRTREAGFDYHSVKPFDPAFLQSLVGWRRV